MPSGDTKRGFSLIEIMAVLVIMAIVVAAVSLRLEGPLHQAGMKDAVGQITQVDHLARAYCRNRNAAARIVVDLTAGKILIADKEGKTLGTEYGLPDGFRITKLLLAGREIGTGAAAIACSRRGLTASYAMLVEGKGRRQWILVPGLTGNAQTSDNEDQIKDILAFIQRPDAG